MTTDTTEDKPNADDALAAYPSIELAYPLAVACYDTAIKRFDSIDGRLQTIIAFVAAVSVAIPSIASG